MTTPDTHMCKQMASCEVAHADYAATFSALRQRFAQSLLDAPSGQTLAGAAGIGKSLSMRALVRDQGGRHGGQLPGEFMRTSALLAAAAATAQGQNYSARPDHTTSELAPNRNGEHT